MSERIDRPAPWLPWALISAMLLLVAIAAYAAGAHHGIPNGGAPPRGWMFFPFGWFVFPLFWIFLFGAMRWMFWGGWYGPWRWRRYYRARWYDADREDWEHWHRREHERMDAGHAARTPDSGPPRDAM